MRSRSGSQPGITLLVAIGLLRALTACIGRAAEPFPTPFDSERDAAARPLPAANTKEGMNVTASFILTVLSA